MMEGSRRAIGSLVALLLVPFAALLDKSYLGFRSASRAWRPARLCRFPTGRIVWPAFRQAQ